MWNKTTQEGYQILIRQLFKEKIEALRAEGLDKDEIYEKLTGTTFPLHQAQQIINPVVAACKESEITEEDFRPDD